MPSNRIQKQFPSKILSRKLSQLPRKRKPPEHQFKIVYLCSYCLVDNEYATYQDRFRHLLLAHPDLLNQYSSYICCQIDCCHIFTFLQDYMQHLNETHEQSGFKVHFEQLHFDSVQKFESWKDQIETRYKFNDCTDKLNLVEGEQVTKNEVNKIYYCSRYDIEKTTTNLEVDSDTADNEDLASNDPPNSDPPNSDLPQSDSSNHDPTQPELPQLDLAQSDQTQPDPSIPELPTSPTPAPSTSKQSHKTTLSCPASIFTKINTLTGHVTVQYCRTHLDHEADYHAPTPKPRNISTASAQRRAEEIRAISQNGSLTVEDKQLLVRELITSKFNLQSVIKKFTNSKIDDRHKKSINSITRRDLFALMQEFRLHERNQLLYYSGRKAVSRRFEDLVRVYNEHSYVKVDGEPMEGAEPDNNSHDDDPKNLAVDEEPEAEESSSLEAWNNDGFEVSYDDDDERSSSPVFGQLEIEVVEYETELIQNDPEEPLHIEEPQIEPEPMIVEYANEQVLYEFIPDYSEPKSKNYHVQHQQQMYLKQPQPQPPLLTNIITLSDLDQNPSYSVILNSLRRQSVADVINSIDLARFSPENFELFLSTIKVAAAELGLGS